MEHDTKAVSPVGGIADELPTKISPPPPHPSQTRSGGGDAKLPMVEELLVHEDGVQPNESFAMQRKLLGWWRVLVPFLQSLRLLSHEEVDVKKLQGRLLYAVQLTRIMPIRILFLFYAYLFVAIVLARAVWLQVLYVLFYSLIVVTTFTMPIGSYETKHYRTVCFTLGGSIVVTMVTQILFSSLFSSITASVMILGQVMLVFALVFRINDVLMYRRKSD